MKFKTILSTGVIASTIAIISPELYARDTNENKSVGGYLAIGTIALPEFEGADDYQAVPLIFTKIEYSNYYFEVQGLGMRANISPFREIEFGPSISYRMQRDEDIDNIAVSRLREVDSAFEVGIFAKVPFYGVLDRTDQLAFDIDILTDVSSAHEGTLVTLGSSYSYSPTTKLRLAGSISTTYANDDYMETYYSIDANNARRSGLSIFNAEGGFKEIGFTFTGNYQFNSQWGLTGILGYEQLLGDAADSTIVTEVGNKDQFMVGVGVFYRF